MDCSFSGFQGGRVRSLRRRYPLGSAVRSRCGDRGLVALGVLLGGARAWASARVSEMCPALLDRWAMTYSFRLLVGRHRKLSRVYDGDDVVRETNRFVLGEAAWRSVGIGPWTCHFPRPAHATPRLQLAGLGIRALSDELARLHWAAAATRAVARQLERCSRSWAEGVTSALQGRSMIAGRVSGEREFRWRRILATEFVLEGRLKKETPRKSGVSFL